MAISAGTLLGRYEIRSLIGTGGMGEVYRAYDPKLRREVAIKVLPAGFATDEDRLGRFEQEAQAAGALNHPNILSVYDVDTFDGAPYVVSELLEGETLRKRMSGALLPQRKAIDCGLQIAKGLAAAHDKGIVHRDLKPENLFLTTDGRVKILDFGLAKLIRPQFAAEVDMEAATMHAHTDPGQVMGAVGYMSPEQVRGQRVDHRADIFAFGAVLYEMLSGKRAFHGESAVETLSAILKEEPPDLAETNRQIAPGLERVVRHCLEKSPAQRFQSANDLAFALEALSAPSVISAGTKTLPVPVSVSAWSKRRLWLTAAGAVLLATATLASFFAGVRIGEKPSPSFHQLTFRNGRVWAARFAPDGQTIVFAASWEGKPSEIFSTRVEGTESRPLGLADANILAISSAGEMVVTLDARFMGLPLRGTLARVPLAGGAPREVLEDVEWADWSPNGKDLAVVRYVNGRYQLEFPIGKVLHKTDGWISHARISPKGDRIAFLEHPVRYDDRGSMIVVDLAGNKKTLSNNISEYGLAWSPAGDEIWFIGSDEIANSSLQAMTVSGRQRFVMKVPGRIELYDISPDGRILLGRDTIRMGILGLPPGESKERDLSWLDGPFARDISADGKTILFDEAGAGGGLYASVYLRATDGSPAVRLGDGDPISMSPDGKWVLASIRTTPLQLVLMPTGAGQPRPLPNEGINYHEVGSWFPDSKRILFVGDEPGHGPRCYMLDTTVAGARPRPITPEGITAAGLTSPEAIAGGLITPDGAYVIAGRSPQEIALYPVEGGEPRPIRGFEPGDVSIHWSADGRALYLFRHGDLPARVYRLDIATGRRELWKQMMPSDPAGIVVIWTVVMTSDAKSYAYTYGRFLSELYLVRALQ